MPVGTQGSVKAVSPHDLKAMGAGMLLSNTYHLSLRPGPDVISKLGGLHKFMAWDGPILTDSGGFQVFSLARLRKVTFEGIHFQSHLDGSEHFLSPEEAIRIQEALGADIIMALDHCAAYGESPQVVREAMERTHAWALRCKAAHHRPDQALFGIVQGGFSPEWRRESAKLITSLDLPGYAIGGTAVGEPKSLMWKMVAITVPLLPEDRPRYLMGVGSPEDLVEGVARGIDMFDCVLPTRIARNGALLTREGRANLRSARFREHGGPVEEGCDCYTCQHFSLAYLHHLFKAEELLVYRLVTIHNLRFVLRLMEEMRRAIVDGSFAEYRRRFLASYRPVDEAVAQEQKRRWRLFNLSKPPPSEANTDGDGA
jgi:queuine tRNA-ribosyltransferase